jgi:tRNA(Ile)-lysidine synthase
MIKQILQKLENAGVTKRTRILCAVSGGIDSTVMLHVLHDLDLDCIVAHCNFKLRGDDSYKDQEFVKKLAAKFEYKFITQDFNTSEYSEKNRISIQMAARDLRYEFFFEAAEKSNCDFIALAHNSDDQVETVITNFARGTGIRGLTGMSDLKGKLLRPLLGTSRNQIEVYVKENYIEYRTDITNAQTKYSRNKIRHEIIPLLCEINSAVKENILRSVNYLEDTEKILKAYVSEAYNSCVYFTDDAAIVELKVLEKFAAPETVLYEMLLKLDIPKSLAKDAIGLITAQSGKYCSFLNIRILKNRGNLIIEKKYKQDFISEEFEDLESLREIAKLGYSFKIENYTPGFKIDKDQSKAYIDFDLVKFPLVVRNWKHGDKFRPLGMKKFKKISDFFVDMKLSVHEKDKVDIFLSGEDIIWVGGMRIDDRFKLTDRTNKVLIFCKESK